MTGKISPVLSEEVFEDLVWHLLDEWITAKYAKDEVTKTICGLFRAGIQQAKREIFEEIERLSVESGFEDMGKYRSWQMTEEKWQALKSKHLKG